MSLWQKPLDEIDFEDIAVFCAAKPRENARLDYKLTFPGNLEKTIAAFANTIGGLILLGVDSEKNSNSPIWPPVTGMPSEPGLEERVYQKATEAIYPPVRTVGVSRVIENKLLSDHVLIVIRLDESKDAPHAVEKGREIYTYERSGNKTDAHKLAHIDRIQYLLHRRRELESSRNEARLTAIIRAESLIDQRVFPIIWCSVIPLYPWQQPCKPSACYAYLRQFLWSDAVQRIPRGGISIGRTPPETPEVGTVTCKTITCTDEGHFLVLKSVLGISQTKGDVIPLRELRSRVFPFDQFWARYHEMIEYAQRFYDTAELSRVGLLSIEIGAKHIKGCRVMNPARPGSAYPFIDDEYREHVVISASEFARKDCEAVNALYRRLAFAFDVDTLPGE